MLRAEAAGVCDVATAAWPAPASAHVVLANELLDNLPVRITAGGSELYVGDTGETDWVELSVDDEGVGVAPEQLERIFEEFVQVEPGTRQGMPDGAGLGLAICRRLCRLMGGDIVATSVLGEGSRFVVTLPVSPQPPDPVPAG